MSERVQRSDLIQLLGMSFFSHIGYFDFEQEQGQNFVLDLILELGRPLAMGNDELADSVSYADVFTLCEDFMARARQQLLEAAAAELVGEILERFPAILAVDLTLRKPEAPIDGHFDAMAVQIYRRRWTEFALALGGNRGDVLAHFQDCLKRLILDPSFRALRASSVYISPAWGVTDQPDFYNAVVLGETRLEPDALLARLKELERELGRKPSQRWHEREIDLDLISYGEVHSEQKHLTLPHPRASQRPFVMVPLREVRDGIILQDPELERMGLKWLTRLPDFSGLAYAEEERLMSEESHHGR